MNQLTSQTLPEEPVLSRPMLESLEPRRLLSAAMPEPVISFAEFSFGASGGSSMDAVPVQVDYHAFVSPPLGARRIVETFTSPFGDRSFSVTFFVTPWSGQNTGANTDSNAQTPSTPTYEPKEPTNNPSKDAKEDAGEQITTLAVESDAKTTALPSVQPVTDAPAFATNVIEAVNPTPITTAKRASENASRPAQATSLELLHRDDELIETTARTAPAHAWYQVLDRDVRQEHRAAQDNALANDRSEIVTRPADQADSLRTLALRMAKEQNLVHVLRPATASAESTPVSMWQRIAMVTLTGGALVANWYVRRRRAKLALSGFEKTKVGQDPYLP